MENRENDSVLIFYRKWVNFITFSLFHYSIKQLVTRWSDIHTYYIQLTFYYAVT